MVTSVGPGAIRTLVADDLTCLMVFIGFTGWLLLLACYVARVTRAVTAMKTQVKLGCGILNRTMLS